MEPSEERPLGNSLLTSGDISSHAFLNGPTPANTHASLQRLAKYLGLNTVAAVRSWLDSDQFRPIFDALYTNAILPRLQRRVALQGPKLHMVQAAISKGEKFGDMRYSSRNVDLTDFTELDHYALCLWDLRSISTSSRNGVFRGKAISDGMKDSRLWQAMLRGSLERGKARSKTLKRNSTGEAKSSTSIFADQPPITPDKKHALGQSSTSSVSPGLHSPSNVPEPAASPLNSTSNVRLPVAPEEASGTVDVLKLRMANTRAFGQFFSNMKTTCD